MNRVYLFAIVIGIGLIIGASMRAGFYSSHATVEHALTLFETHCVGFLSDNFTAPTAPLVRIKQVPQDLMWVDPASEFILSFTANRCVVSDRASAMSATQQDSFTKAASALITDVAPDARQKTQPDVAPLFEIWTIPAQDNTDERGFMLVRFETAPPQHTSLTAFRPETPKTKGFIASLGRKGG